MKVLAIRDRAVDAYGLPIFVVAIGQGVRSFGDEINREGSAYHAHPEDFDLYLLGDFDEQTGTLVPIGVPRQVAIGKDLRSSHVSQSER